MEAFVSDEAWLLVGVFVKDEGVEGFWDVSPGGIGTVCRYSDESLELVEAGDTFNICLHAGIENGLMSLVKHLIRLEFLSSV